MANAIAVKGMRRLIDKVGDEVMEAAKKGSKLEANGMLEAEGAMKVNGNFAFDKDGEIGFVGNVLASVDFGPGTTASIDGPEASSEVDSGWNSKGDGTLEASFRVKVTLHSLVSPA